MYRVNDKFIYKGFGGCTSICNIEIFGDIVICSEAQENNGTSVTNYCEYLIDEVCKYYRLDTERVIWFEINGGCALVSIVNGVPRWSHVAESFIQQTIEKQRLQDDYENYRLYNLI